LTNEPPLVGLRVVEVALGTSTVGAGMATSLPGSLLRDFGADVARVQTRRRLSLDAGVDFARAWDHGKEIVTVDEGDAASVVTALAHDADVLFLAGDEAVVEAEGLGSRQLCRANPRLVAVRIRPSWDARGTVPDLELLVAVRAGLPTQIRSHHGGPAFPDLPVASAGAALAATAGALACLFEREATDRGGWAETSLADGLRALLPMITGRVEQPSATTDLLWRGQGPAEALSYCCADGEYVQLWFGAKGAYEAFLEHVGDPPSERGYNADLVSGAMVERGERWAAMFATRERTFWLDDLSGRDFRCEPVLRPGEALKDAHVREVGLTRRHDGLTVLGPPVRVTRVGPGEPSRVDPARRLLDGVRVVDLSAYLAGPITSLVLAELGADVVKVEPPTGDVHRNMEPMFAAGQRGKRALALDLKAPDAAQVLERLFRWTDVVHHNSRVGLAERLGYDEETVRAANPDVVYSFASGFGDSGPRARLPTNDQLMQALAGVESAQGGADRPPTYLVWGAVDVTGGWLAACGVLAGLYARRARGGGQSVRSSLLGAGLTLKSGAFLAEDTVVPGPVLDADQRGYGAAYRLYQGGDGEWFALAVPDESAWARLRRVVGVELPAVPPPLRTNGARQPAEELLERAFARDAASRWLAALRDADVPVEPVAPMTRSEFVDAFVDDPVNRQLGRVVSYQWGDRGLLEQPGLSVRFGPAPRPHACASIPALGEHTEEVLGTLS
jgi:crotonobetainyl-CoA:carnitine CoA-transferase CaiB-like acyl-CoA transferase